jgi:hypothetical protein
MHDWAGPAHPTLEHDNVLDAVQEPPSGLTDQTTHWLGLAYAIQ